ncbi:MAG: hypothetical protein MJ033_01790 [Victivallaceae bacterium]|nr:hypothetical protein [Victivallaceae bacterium]
MSDQILSPEAIKALLMSLAAGHAVRKLVEHLVIGDLPFEDKDIHGDWPYSRMDGTEANYYSFFKDKLLPSDMDAEDDISYKAALRVVKSFFTACENENQEEILRQGTLLFNGFIKEHKPEYLAQQTIIDSIYSSEPFSAMSDNEKEQNKDGLKAAFVLKQILATYRRMKAEVELEHDFKYPTLEENVEAIIYATILITERLLQEHEIACDVLAEMWQCGGFFCDMWFASTIVDDPETEKSQTIREQIIEVSETWPDYAQNMTFILDYAAIIQDRLFSNRHHNPEKNWLQESFKVWNAYAAAALRLGEIYSKYRNHLPLNNAEIASLKARFEKRKPLIVTEGKTDWMHIKNAYRHFKRMGRYPNMLLSFWENTENLGDEAMLRMCKEYAKVPQERPVIFIADADNARIIREMSEHGKNFKCWGNNVFSFCLPSPPHRKKYKRLSIEFYYTDEEIGTPDPISKRRLLFSNQVKETIEKNKTTNRHQSFVRLCNPNIADEYMKYIYDDCCDLIEDDHGNKVAHSKYTFAKKIYDGEPGFDKFDISNFSLIFDVIESILSPA